LIQERHLAPSSLEIAVCALRFLYHVTLKRSWSADHVIPAPKKPRRLPVVLSPDEVVRALACVASPKHRAVLTTCYAAGLRISEAVRLRPRDVDSQRMVMRIEQGKGQRDRYVMLSPKLLEVLRAWWRRRRAATRRPHETPHPTCTASLFRRPSAGSRDRRAHDSTAPGPPPSRDHRSLSADRHDEGLCDHQPARPPPHAGATCRPVHAVRRVTRAVVVRPTLEVAEIFRRYGDIYRAAAGSALSTAQRRVMTAIETCRTAVLGGHVEACNACGHQRIAYNSCANRHCPKCQSLARAAWIERRRVEILDCENFHVVFTVPDAIAALAAQNKAQVYGILFRATAETLRTIAADPQHLGAEIGFVAVLHTWGQTLVHHPHLHCVVPGGGLSPDGTRWVACRPGFFLPVRVLSRLFRRLFLHALQAAYDARTLRLVGSLESLRDRPTWTSALATLRRTEWVVYAKRPFAGPQQVVDYVGRYTHRVAISNNRLLDANGGQVRFTDKDYRAAPTASSKTMTLAATEFIRRFLLHVLPTGFHRIRYYGFLGARHRREKLTRCRQLLGSTASVMMPTDPTVRTDYRDRVEALTGVSRRVCPACHHGEMTLIDRLVPAARARFVNPDTS
jgi:hypothetical protein